MYLKPFQCILEAMKYKRIYDELIAMAKARTPLDGVYYECHHVVPMSMGGSNKKENLAVLTAREHFIAHWLLYKIHRNAPMATAWYFMRVDPTGKGMRYSSSAFEYAKRAHIKHLTGRKHTEEHKRKISEAGMGRKGTEAQKRATELANKNRKWSDESRAKASAAKKKALRSKHNRARKVINKDTGQVFDCMVDAAESIGVTKSAIHNQIKRGGKNKGFAFGYYA